MPPSSVPPIRPLPQPIENTKRVMRRFAPDPVETTARSSRPPQLHGQDSDRPRRPLPQPVESSARSSKKPNDTASTAVTSNVISPLRPTLPQPIDSTKSSSMSRKFMPQLVETTSRQRKRGDTLPAVLDSDKTEHSPDSPIYLPRHLRIPRPGVLPVPPENSPTVSTDQVPQLQASRFSYESLSRRSSLDQPDRRHSFRRPDLPSIPSQTEESEDTDDSSCPSLSTTPSARSEEIELLKNATRAQCGDASGHILALAAQAAQKQLREQAMAAYPNERTHEYVDHFAIDREDGGEEGVGLLSRSATYPPPAGSEIVSSVSRRESHAGWEAAEMRKHSQNLERQRKEHKQKERSMVANRKHSVKETSKEHHQGHHHHHHHDNHHEHHHHKRQPSDPKTKAARNNVIGGHQKDDQMKPMHKAASPPMAGQNLNFPKCQSPRQTRLDVGQHPGVAIRVGTPKSREHSGLWTPQGAVSRQNSMNGLWMGVCASSAMPATPVVFQTGLLTPAVERDDPFVPTGQTSKQQMPPSPPESDSSSKACCLNQILSREKAIEEEFHDGFITQVYNYLSLGYPALARKYDDELSKITRIPIENLRQDDQHANAKGYVGAPEGTGCDLRGVQDGQCERWTALRLYIVEWAQQQSRMGVRDGAANEDWGARARKGSWAL
ncbi:MAG: hypothetical protein L6R38_006426 [Xanthoria sp. 2 TBL-2021]|nr:MAG: hypothetical protein L6R38_006426 [Xanthoria sp. 2 TBL-2021]